MLRIGRIIPGMLFLSHACRIECIKSDGTFPSTTAILTFEVLINSSVAYVPSMKHIRERDQCARKRTSSNRIESKIDIFATAVMRLPSLSRIALYTAVDPFCLVVMSEVSYRSDSLSRPSSTMTTTYTCHPDILHLLLEELAEKVITDNRNEFCASFSRAETRLGNVAPDATQVLKACSWIGCLADKLDGQRIL